MTRRESNRFLHNLGGGRGFRDATDEVGLSLHLATSAYVTLDFDRDGDLDIVARTILGPVVLFVNRSGGRSISIELRDSRGNRFGIGSRVSLHLSDGSSQLRLLEAGGGFASSPAPIAHFGLGPHAEVAAVEVRWSTGETTTLQGKFPEAGRYVIVRDASALPHLTRH